MHLVLKFWLWGRFVAEKQTFVLNLMAGHLLNMTYNENGKWNVWELDHYTDRSSLGIHFWDLYWKMVYLKFEKFWYSNVRPWETVQIWGDCPRYQCGSRLLSEASKQEELPNQLRAMLTLLRDDNWCFTFEIWDLIFDIWYLIFDICYLTFDIWHSQPAASNAYPAQGWFLMFYIWE